MGLDKLGTIPVYRDSGAPRCYKQKSTFNPEHIAGILRKTLEASPGTMSVNINRMLLVHFKALCEAIVRVQPNDASTGKP